MSLPSDAFPTLQSCPLPHTGSLMPVCSLSEYSSNQFIYLISTDILHNDQLKIKTDIPWRCRKVSVKRYDIRVNANICIKKAHTVTDQCVLVS